MSSIGRLLNDIRFILQISSITRRAEAVKPTDEASVADLIEHWARKTPNAKAIWFEDRSYSYRDWNEASNRYALWGQSVGLKRGDTVALLMENRPEYLFAWGGMAKIGVITALINTNQRERALAHSLTISQGQHLILGSELAGNLQSALHLLDAPIKVWATGGSVPGALDLDGVLAGQVPARFDASIRKGMKASAKCFYIYTSGTTGLPKAANISHYRAHRMMRTFAALMNSKPSDRVYIVLPLYHSAGGVCAVGIGLVAGGSVILRRRFSASQFWDDCFKYKATMFQYIGELCRYMLNAPPHPLEQKHSLTAITGNGLRPEIWGAFQARFKIPKIFEFYGATEGNVALLNLDGKIGAIGRIPPLVAKSAPTKLFRFDIEREQPVRGANGFCIVCEPGEVGEAMGEIADKGGQRFEGYSKGSDTDKKILRDVLKKGDAWFRTGDLMKRDAEGYYYFVDRIGDTFRWKGENVSTNEVAEAISVYPGIKEANVYGVQVPGADGRAGMAALVTAGPLDLKLFYKHLEKNLPAYARPIFLRMQQEIAATGTFKHTKVDLVKEGYNPSAIKDPLFVFDLMKAEYVPLTPELYQMIQEARFRW